VRENDRIRSGLPVDVEPCLEEVVDSKSDGEDLVLHPEELLGRTEDHSGRRSEIVTTKEFSEEEGRRGEESEGEVKGSLEGGVDCRVVRSHLFDQDRESATDDLSLGTVGDVRRMVVVTDDPVSGVSRVRRRNLRRRLRHRNGLWARRDGGGSRSNTFELDGSFEDGRDEGDVLVVDREGSSSL